MNFERAQNELKNPSPFCRVHELLAAPRILQSRRNVLKIYPFGTKFHNVLV